MVEPQTLRRRAYRDITQTTFNTPMVQLRRVIDPDRATVFVKCEFFNPLSSVKDRIGVSMIDAAEKAGQLKPGMHIVEPTSGNTGIALAFVAAARGYKLTLTMPSVMSTERRALLRALGANVILTEESDGGMGAAIARAIEMTSDDPNTWMPMQFENPANPAIHETTTGPEIWEDAGHDIDAIVTGVGTGGTITGVTRCLREHNPDFLAFAVEPEASSVLSGGKPGWHDIQGIGAGFIPKTCDTSLLDGVVTVSTEEAYAWARRLAVEEGIFVGISSGANVCAVAKAIDQFDLADMRIVTVACSAGERYLSTKLFEPLRD